MFRRRVISRHRLPQPYRAALAALWLALPLLLIAAVVAGRGLDAALLDPRLWLPALLMGLPALYVWQEGVDIVPGGMIARVFWPRYYPFERLDSWYYDARPQRRVLTVWDDARRKALECRAAHLTDLPRLLDALKRHVRDRRWPE